LRSLDWDGLSLIIKHFPVSSGIFSNQRSCKEKTKIFRVIFVGFLSQISNLQDYMLSFLGDSAEIKILFQIGKFKFKAE
jgi:hypothetical protein